MPSLAREVERAHNSWKVCQVVGSSAIFFSENRVQLYQKYSTSLQCGSIRMSPGQPKHNAVSSTSLHHPGLHYCQKKVHIDCIGILYHLGNLSFTDGLWLWKKIRRLVENYNTFLPLPQQGLGCIKKWRSIERLYAPSICKCKCKCMHFKNIALIGSTEI